MAKGRESPIAPTIPHHEAGVTPTSTTSTMFSPIQIPSPNVQGTSPQTYSCSSSPDYGTLGLSPSLSQDGGETLPTNVSTQEQLELLPDFCRSRNKELPLRHVNEKGDVSLYALQPMFFSVIFILCVELLERFSFYGVSYTQTLFLTGMYNADWNAGMTAVGASSYVSVSTAVAYTTPFLGAMMSDSLLGEYWTILAGTLLLYIPGLVLIAMSTVPYLLGDTFNDFLLALGLLVLWPMGTGMVKSTVNVFGAKQFHPLLQSSLIESYFVSFYMCINVGALVGGMLVPIVAQYDITLAYSCPVGMLCIGMFLFVLGTQRYVKQRPTGKVFSSKKKSTTITNDGDANSIGLCTIFTVSSLIIPFSIAYSQMATTFIVQGTVMKNAFGLVDAASMNNADAISVLLFGHVVGAYLYPLLASREIKIPTTYKFAIGSGFGALAIAWALFVEHMIHSTYEKSGQPVNILWQSMSYILIGAGEIFAISAAYEAAFTASPPEKKVVASAINLFCVGGIPNVLCIFLYQACRNWFKNSKGTANISRLEDYTSARVDLYFIVLFVISILGVIINLLPQIRDFVASVEEQAIELSKTPNIRKSPHTRRRHRLLQQQQRRKKLSLSFSRQQQDSPYGSSEDDEGSPMLRMKRHQAYMKYGSGPMLYKQGSMRAGPTTKRESKRPLLKKSFVGKLYRTKQQQQQQQQQQQPQQLPAMIPPKVVLDTSGKPITAGKVYKRQDSL